MKQRGDEKKSLTNPNNPSYTFLLVGLLYNKPTLITNFIRVRNPNIYIRSTFLRKYTSAHTNSFIASKILLKQLSNLHQPLLF